MTDTVITVENLSKSYLVGHMSAERGHHRYTTMRDVIARGVHNFARKAGDMLHGRQVVQGDEIEEFWALKDVSFEVKQGEVLGIIGRNGAGKSTLLKILSRITEPTKGHVLLRGRIASLLEVGTGFHPELTGRENIFLNGAILGMTQREIRAKFDEIVAFAEVEKFLDTPVKRYSSGMYVRLAFAVAAHLEPEILVVDEVLAVGDHEFQRKCLAKMSEVARGGRTVLFVSHNHAAIRSLCTHGLMLLAGASTPKQDVSSILELYSSEQQTALASSWKRPANSDNGANHFESIDVCIHGEQPRLRLLCNAVIRSEQAARRMFIAVDVLDRSSGVIMQAIPKPEPFFGGTPGEYRIDLGIELPPLIPGIYSLDFWVGPHHTETFDHVRRAITIEILDSPIPGRSFPHTPDHGYIAPVSTVSVRSSADMAPSRLRIA
ncbi:ABC-type polysaccharide/polyol phosphate transport system, ATPase component [Rhizobiales bacterium GAS191]|nr:ABC-type polysaccharide/polyol phosphate transport system, ATPase component [Rhizobiales bacterium GAS188]SEE43781.1 ABC-type polysaccharide/polyol phosphate transport system, ATPase component [Rhizobiales bacterium GAS191]